MFFLETNLLSILSNSFKVEELTFDHVIPKSRGGQTSWENVVTCRKCNTLKGNKPLKKTQFDLKSPPYTPNNYELKEIGRLFPPIFSTKVGTISLLIRIRTLIELFEILTRLS